MLDMVDIRIEDFLVKKSIFISISVIHRMSGFTINFKDKLCLNPMQQSTKGGSKDQKDPLSGFIFANFCRIDFKIQIK